MPELINGKRCKGIHNRNDSGKRSGPTWKVLMRWLMDNGFEKCQLCGTTENLTFDHIIAWSNGGSNDISNYAILCAPCNEAKGNKYIDLEPLTWPHPAFNEVMFRDLKPGMFTMFGEVEDIRLHGVYDEKEIYVVKFCGQNLIKAMRPDKIQKRSRYNEMIYRPGDQPMLLDPRHPMV